MSGAISRWLKNNAFILAIIGIMVLAAFMRFYQLASLPPGLHPDEAANGLDVFRIFNHDYRPFYTTNGGREALFFYLQAIGVSIFGNTILGLRAAPALLGTLAVAAVYLWSASWFGRRVGLLAALLMAVTPWGVTISRDGFRASMLMLMIPLTLWLGTKAIQTKGKLWLALAGISFGAGFYTYIAYRLFPVALFAIGLYILIWRRHYIKQWKRPLLVFGIATTVALLPLGIFTLQHPADVAGRPAGVSFLNKDLNHGKPLQTLSDTLVKTALMFNITGDENYRQNLGGQPAFNVFVGVMFLLGIFVAIARIKRLAYFSLLMVFGAMLLPEVLTAEGIPHFLRAIGALAPALVLAAVGISYLLNQWYSVFPLNRAARAAGTVAVGILLALTVYQGYVQYFVAWANSQQTYDDYAEDAVALGNYYVDNRFNGKRYAVTGEYSMQTVEYLTHNKSNYMHVDTNKVDGIPLDAGTAKEFAVFENDQEQVLKRLRQKFPKGQTSPHYSTFSGDELFVIYTVPAQ